MGDAMTFTAYALRGPGPTYVGVTRDPALRWYQHQWIASRAPKERESPIYGAMRSSGGYRMEILAQMRGTRLDALPLERQLIAQCIDGGEPLANRCNYSRRYANGERPALEAQLHKCIWDCPCPVPRCRALIGERCRGSRGVWSGVHWERTSFVDRWRRLIAPGEVPA